MADANEDKPYLVQTNEHGYVTGVLSKENEILVGLHGGTKTMRVTVKQADEINEVLAHYRSMGKGLLLSRVADCLKSR